MSRETGLNGPTWCLSAHLVSILSGDISRFAKNKGSTLALQQFCRMFAARMSTFKTPKFISPMLCKGVTELPRCEDWLFEIKSDGCRAMMFPSFLAMGRR